MIVNDQSIYHETGYPKDHYEKCEIQISRKALPFPIQELWKSFLRKRVQNETQQVFKERRHYD